VGWEVAGSLEVGLELDVNGGFWLGTSTRLHASAVYFLRSGRNWTWSGS
jgi:hypothetical protein